MKRKKTKQILACVLSVLAVAVYVPANVGTGGFLTGGTEIVAKATEYNFYEGDFSALDNIVM